VFGRKFEKELEKLRKELADMSASRAATPAESTGSLPRDTDASSESDDDTRSNSAPLEMGSSNSGINIGDSTPKPLAEKKEQ
jgi:hypothetical protein